MISKKEVKHIAKLARLGITESEEEKFQKELSSILDYFTSLKEVNVEGVEPTFHVLPKKEEIMRKDERKKQPIEKVNKLIEMAPEKKKRYIRVKSVL
ncbi:Asp-tRNA(Asn)/Glu-tRNA(Gln) amidotransferase subunit GatC [Patescibacteria group bacterium]|nr:Asp-tRNA(Asn)/Glu-tRNA(Gln) amidotransferase subunit GatC [Patescibacteria group bacterium]